MKTLHLNLKKKWFDMILSGEKTEEYRNITEHYVKLLFHWKDSGLSLIDFTEDLRQKEDDSLTWMYLKFNDDTPITFSNGYATKRPQFIIEWMFIDIKKGKTKWGAEEDKKYFVLSLGKIIKL